MALWALVGVLLSGTTAMGASGDALEKKGMTLYKQGKFAQAAQVFEKASAAHEKKKNVVGAANCAYNQGLCLGKGFDFEKTGQAYSRAAELYGKASDGKKQANALVAGAQAFFGARQMDRAEDMYAQARTLAEKIEQPLLQGLALEGLGKVAVTSGQVAHGRALYEKALPLVADVPSASVRIRLQYAACLQKMGDLEGALDACAAAEAQAASLKKNEKTEPLGRLLLFSTYAQKANAYTMMGNYVQGVEGYTSALDEVKGLSGFDERQKFMAETNRVVAQGEIENVPFASKTLEDILNTARKKGWHEMECVGLQAQGRLLRGEGKYKDTYERFFQAKDIAQKHGLKNRYLQSVVNIADLYYALGMWEESRNSFQEALAGSIFQSDMEMFLVSTVGLNRIVRGQDLGLSGKVDYRAIQGVPWKGLLQPHGDFQEDFFRTYWRSLDALSTKWYEASSVLDADRTVEAISSILGWRRTEGIARYAVADGTLRTVEKRFGIVEDVAQGIRGLQEAKHKVPLQLWTALRRAAGERLLAGAVGSMPIQSEGLIIEGQEPEPVASDDQGLRQSLESVSSIPRFLGMDDKAEAEMVKSLVRGDPLSSDIRGRLARVHSQRARRDSDKMAQELRAEKTRGGALNEMAQRVSEIMANLTEKRLVSSDIRSELDDVSPFMVCQIASATSLKAQEQGWNDLALRMNLLRRLGVEDMKAVSSMKDFLKALPSALKGGRDKLGSMKDDVEGLVALARSLGDDQLSRETALCELFRKSGGGMSFDSDRALDLLMCRIALVRGDLEGADRAVDDLKERYKLTARIASKELPNPDLAWRSLVLSARAKLKKGERARALDELDEAISVIESISPAEGSESRATTDRLEAYKLAIQESYGAWRETPDRNSMDRVWRALEGMKSRQWREILSSTGLGFLNRLSSEERDTYRNLKGEVTTLEGGVRMASRGGDLDKMLLYVAELRKKRKELDEFMAAHTVVGSVAVPEMERIAGLLPSDWAVVDYYISQKCSFAFVLRRDEPAALIPLDLDYSLFFAYLQRMRGVKGEEFSLVRTSAERRVFGFNGQDLEHMLFAPIRALLGPVRNVLVIPHDLLFLYPYETMVSQENGESTFLLKQGWNFAEIPSASLLEYGSGREDPPSDSLMVVANPKYLYTRGMQADEKKEAERILSDADSPIDAAVRRKAGPAMTPLAGTQKEADLIAGIWKDSQKEVTCLLGDQASEKLMISSDIGAHGFVHFACHGYDRNSIPFLQPGLALSPASDRGNDSFAQMGELAALPWQSKMVVLSACDTGLGDLYIGDGMVGLNTVFLSGGARGVVLSRWLVPDKIAPIIMDGLYKGIAEGLSPTRALNEAKLAVLADEEPATGWAVFKYVGIPWSHTP